MVSPNVRVVSLLSFLLKKKQSTREEASTSWRQETSRGNCNIHSRVRCNSLARGFGAPISKTKRNFIGSFFSISRLFYPFFSDSSEYTPNTNSIFSFLFFFSFISSSPKSQQRESLRDTECIHAGRDPAPSQLRSGQVTRASCPARCPRSPWVTDGGRGEAGRKGVQPARPPHDTLAGTW